MKILQIKVIAALMFCAFTFSGCKNDAVQPDPEFDSQKFASCSESTSWDYATTKGKLIGLWEWQYVLCCGEGSKPEKDETVSKGLKIEFKDDGTGILVDFDAIGDFKWDIQLVDNFYEFSTDPYIPQLEGKIVICGDMMQTNASYRDGASNYYKKN